MTDLNDSRRAVLQEPRSFVPPKPHINIYRKDREYDDKGNQLIPIFPEDIWTLSIKDAIRLFRDLQAALRAADIFAAEE